MENQPHVETTPEKIPEEALVLLGEVQTSDEIEQEGKQEESSAYTMEMAMDEAGFLVELAADGAEGLHPAINYDKDVREKVARRLAPVLLKYDGKLPPWLERWKEEIFLSITLGGVAYGTVKAIREYEAKPQKEEGADHAEA